jgi:hypothetical protein
MLAYARLILDKIRSLRRGYENANSRKLVRTVECARGVQHYSTTPRTRLEFSTKTMKYHLSARKKK